jgi:hypothetical protein
MSQIDKTRDKIKIEELTNQDRKVLFEKFVKAGGQVVKEKKHHPVKINRAKQKEFAQKLDQQHKNSSLTSRQDSENTQRFKSTSIPTTYHSSGLDSFWAKIHLYFLGVTTLNGSFFRTKFLEQFRSSFNPALMELQIIYLDLFKQNPTIGAKTVEEMDKIRPIYYELIEMTGDIWEKSLSAALIDKFAILPNEKYRVYDHRDPILIYLRKLYILFRYVDTTNFAFDKAIELQSKFERGNPSVYAAKRKKIKNDLYIVFYKFFPRLYWLFSMMRGEIISLENDRRFDDLFEIKPFMKPGTRTAGYENPSLASYNGSSKKEIIKKDNDSAEELESISEEVRRGLDLMNEINLPSLKESACKDDIFSTADDNDRILLTFLYFTEFDREYSCILTTFKIKFFNLHDSRGQLNFRGKLTDIYNQMRSPYDALRAYFLSLQQYEAARLDRPTSNDQYYKYTKRLTELDSDKKIKARDARNAVFSFMKTVTDALSILIKDMNTRKEMIQNPQDILDFDSVLEANLKLNGRKIFSAIVMAHSFSSALLFRLSPGGDLCGDIDTGLPAQSSSFLSAGNTPVAPSQVRTIPNPNFKPTQNKSSGFQQAEDTDNSKISILGELNDIDKIDETF